MTDQEIAIELYRDGMDRKKIRAKLEIDTPTLREYLVGQPSRHSKPRENYRYTPPKPTVANVKGRAMIKQGVPAKAVHAELAAQGLKISLSTVLRWQTAINGAVNNRVPKSDYPVIKELITTHPDARGSALSKLYHQRTGRRLDRRAAHYWCRKQRAAA